MIVMRRKIRGDSGGETVFWIDLVLFSIYRVWRLVYRSLVWVV